MKKRPENHLKEMLLKLCDMKVDFIVCGGVALVIQGGERMTLDLDLSVDMHHKNIKRFSNTMSVLGLEPRVPVPAEALLDPEAIDTMIKKKRALVFTFIDTENPFRQINIFLTDEHSFKYLSTDIDSIPMDGRIIKTLTRRRLLAMKEAISPPRDKDLLDIKILRQLINEEKQN